MDSIEEPINSGEPNFVNCNVGHFLANYFPKGMRIKTSVEISHKCAGMVIIGTENTCEMKKSGFVILCAPSLCHFAYY
jgi:ATP-dependent phosphoenolpyruvate carboxykinase